MSGTMLAGLMFGLMLVLMAVRIPVALSMFLERLSALLALPPLRAGWVGLWAGWAVASRSVLVASTPISSWAVGVARCCVKAQRPPA